ncbi:MAG TPA: ribonuclease E/G, partial [Segetibacter sp.]
DRAKHAVLPISKFGLMQITRQRMNPEMNINTSEIFPASNGTGKITSTVLLVDEIEKRLLYLVTHQHKNLTLFVNPIVHSHLTKGWFFNSIKYKWNKKFNTKIQILPNANYHLIEFRFYDHNEEEIKI